MSAIEFTANFGDTVKQVEISSAVGNGGDSLHLYIDRFYKGIFSKRDGVWTWLPQNEQKDELTTDDVQILLEMVSQAFG